MGPPDQDSGTDGGLAVFCLHFLGGSGRGWSWVADQLPPGIECVGIDLPGFGSSDVRTGHSIAEMADHVADAIRAHAPPRWMLVGHSMGAKLAAVVARRAEDGAPGLAGLERIVLLAGSPPSPEPMSEERRRTMTGWFGGDEAACREQADGFVRSNVAAELDRSCHARTVEDVLRADRPAWVAWLEGGSREDWAERIGVLRTPALIVSGAEDQDLGPDAQARLMAPHFATHRLVVLPGAAHLLPMEQAGAVARLIAEQAGLVDALSEAGIGSDYRALLLSARVSGTTRAALLERARPDDPEQAPRVLGPLLATLRGVVDRVVPVAARPGVDLAARIETNLERGSGDGWRFAALPPDLQAYRAALTMLDQCAGGSFAELDESRQDRLLGSVADGTLVPPASPGPAADRLDADLMRLWFEDVRAEAVRLYVAHPATLERIGYSGVGYGGDGWPKSGFQRFGIGMREDWEPQPRLGS